MFEAIPLFAEVLTAEPWTPSSIVGGFLLLIGSVALLVGVLVRVGGRR